MKRARRISMLALAVVVAMAACASNIDLDYLKNAECPAGQKLCNDQCVSTTLPQFGCATPASCVPCGLSNATSRCDADGKCAIAACLGTHQDCNHVSDDGCEIDIRHDAAHCGDCLAPQCVVPNSTPDCAAGRCAIRSCDDGFDDCNGDARDGCETNLQIDGVNCGKCGKGCASGARCMGGVCL